MKLTRRTVLGVLGVAAAGCGRTQVFEDEAVEDVVVPPIDLAESGSEEDMKNPVNIPVDATPIHVTASTTLQSNTSAGVNTIALRNPMDTPMEILEVKWQLTIERAGVATFGILGGLIGCKLDLGKIPITNGFVPVWSFGRCISYLRETALVTTGLGVNFYTWRLPRPLYVPSGAVLTPTFQHRGMFPDAITVQVSYSGRSLPAGYAPKSAHVPYVAPYITKSFSSNTSDSDSSTETDLINPFDAPLEVHNMTGRLLAVNSVDLDDSTEAGYAGISGKAVDLRMRESTGRQVINEYTPFRAAFPWATRAWEMPPRTMLPPKAHYIVDVRHTTLGALSPARYFQGFVGLVGTREVA